MRFAEYLRLYSIAVLFAIGMVNASATDRMSFAEFVIGQTSPYWTGDLYVTAHWQRYYLIHFPSPDALVQQVCADVGSTFDHTTNTSPSGSSVFVYCANGELAAALSFGCDNWQQVNHMTGTFWSPQCLIVSGNCFDGFAPSYDSQTHYSCGYVGGVVPPFNQGPSCPSCGNPVNPATGNKFLGKDDYVGDGPFPLVFRRYYNSTQIPRFGNEIARMGSSWRHSYQRFIDVFNYDSYSTAFAKRPDGKVQLFTAHSSQGNPPLSGPYLPDQFVADRLERPIDSPGYSSGWKYTNAEGDVIETYNPAGLLTSLSNRAGLTQQLAYDKYMRLSSVTDPFGRTLTFTYDSSGRIATMQDPAGGLYQYSFDGANNLVSITYPDNTVLTYSYENTSFSNALTGITDENGQRFATYDYDSQKRVTSSQHAGGADSVAFQYGTGTTTVTDARGSIRSYGFVNNFGIPRNNNLSGDACPTCGPASTSYDSKDFVQTKAGVDPLSWTLFNVGIREVHDAP